MPSNATTIHNNLFKHPQPHGIALFRVHTHAHAGCVTNLSSAIRHYPSFTENFAYHFTWVYKLFLD